jgi:hypothetical protein
MSYRNIILLVLAALLAGAVGGILVRFAPLGWLEVAGQIGAPLIGAGATIFAGYLAFNSVMRQSYQLELFEAKKEWNVAASAGVEYRYWVDNLIYFQNDDDVKEKLGNIMKPYTAITGKDIYPATIISSLFPDAPFDIKNKMKVMFMRTWADIVDLDKAVQDQRGGAPMEHIIVFHRRDFHAHLAEMNDAANKAAIYGNELGARIRELKRLIGETKV